MMVKMPDTAKGQITPLKKEKTWEKAQMTNPNKKMNTTAAAKQTTTPTKRRSLGVKIMDDSLSFIYMPQTVALPLKPINK
jgi:hypothetical protein|tara:strand:- start:8314 stop:8553 length:240 start_codon:yes stop_codon:yes gene_type:complete